MVRLKYQFAQAEKLRDMGYSLKEIAQKLNIAKGTASLWLHGKSLNIQALERLKQKGLVGRLRALETRKFKKETMGLFGESQASAVFDNLILTKNHLKIFCALLFWCEGSKLDRCPLTFTNSDPDAVGMFLSLLRSVFDIREEKFHICVHLHDYHSLIKEMNFWSQITNIPLSQFYKPYIKSHTGKISRKDYHGCISVRYSDPLVLVELMAIVRKLKIIGASVNGKLPVSKTGTGGSIPPAPA